MSTHASFNCGNLPHCTALLRNDNVVSFLWDAVICWVTVDTKLMQTGLGLMMKSSMDIKRRTKLLFVLTLYFFIVTDACKAVDLVSASFHSG